MKFLNTLVLGLALCLGVQAQTLQPGLLSASGGSGTTSSGSLDWSVGELVVQTFSAGNQQLTQGFHQNGMTLTPVYEVGGQWISIEVFPNPAAQQLSIQRQGEHLGEQKFVLRNLFGDIQLQGILTSEVTTIELYTLAAQTYFLQIFGQASRQLTVFKIQKID
jgi:hypothetical protein